MIYVVTGNIFKRHLLFLCTYIHWYVYWHCIGSDTNRAGGLECKTGTYIIESTWLFESRPKKCQFQVFFLLQNFFFFYRTRGSAADYCSFVFKLYFVYIMYLTMSLENWAKYKQHCGFFSRYTPM